ncbi:hypothetical protein [Arsenophonus sp. PmNCSU2021_1]|uniref:hypothetical protein n=1 Tax=Arsenophonus sp. PmNCSU2021_1 TaxID=3118989 RepID=UPI002FF2B5BD
MPEFTINVKNNISSLDDIDGELRALKLAICLLATRIPSEQAAVVLEGLKGTNNNYCIELSEVIDKFIKSMDSISSQSVLSFGKNQ